MLTAIGVVGALLGVAAGLHVLGSIATTTIAWVGPRSDKRSLRRCARTDVALIADATAGALAAGVGMTRALTEAGQVVGGPMGDVLDVAVVEHGRGLGLERAIERQRLRIDGPEFDLFVVALKLAIGPLGASPQIFDRVAVGLRARTDARSEIHSQAAQARASAWLVCVLPLLFVAAIAVQGGEVASVLFESALGWWCLALAGALEAVALRWMFVLIRRAER
jgi:tight adherence protein B